MPPTIEAEPDPSGDVERRVRPEVHAGERDEGDDRPRHDPPPAPEIRGRDPGQAREQDDVARDEGGPARRRVPAHDRVGDRRARTRALHHLPDRALGDELAGRHQEAREGEAPSTQRGGDRGGDRTHREDPEELRGAHRRRQDVREPVDRVEHRELDRADGSVARDHAARDDDGEPDQRRDPVGSPPDRTRRPDGTCFARRRIERAPSGCSRCLPRSTVSGNGPARARCRGAGRRSSHVGM